MSLEIKIWKFEIGKMLLLVGILLLSFCFVSSFVYEEASDGKSYYIADSDVIVPSIHIGDVLVLEARTQPANPLIGTIYFDINTNDLMFFDGKDWKIIAFLSSDDLVEKEVVEIQEQESIQDDVVDEDFFTSEDVEKIVEEDSSENVSSESVFNESLEEIENETLDFEKSLDEECYEVCEDVCSIEEECSDVCEEVEICEEVCEVDEEGNENCFDDCFLEEECSEVCSEIEVCEEVCREECGIPEQLFDIRMNLESNVLENSSELRTVVTYESFGRIPTPVNLTFEIFNDNGNVVYLEKGYIVVTVEEVRRYSFENLDLSPGNYKFVFKTLYNVDVYDEFEQNFTIKKPNLFKRIFVWFKNLF